MVSIAAGIERLVIIDPISGGDLSVGKLACLHLSDQDGAGIYETLDWESCCVSRGIEIVVCAVAVTGLEAVNIEDIFDACPYTCEWLSCSPGVVEPGGDGHSWGADPRYCGWESSVCCCCCVEWSHWLCKRSLGVRVEPIRLVKVPGRRNEVGSLRDLCRSLDGSQGCITIPDIDC